MKKLFLDIETLPTEEGRLAIIKELYQKYLAKKQGLAGKILSFDEYHRQTSLDGTLGQILCIGLAQDEQPVEVINSLVPGGETELLEKFWQLTDNQTLFVGHNILDFDLTFIWQRSVILKVKPSIQLNFRRYSTEQVFDTLQVWGNWPRTHEGGSFDRLAKILGLPSSKDKMDGSQVYDYFKAGRFQEIFDYCKADVELVRRVYKRLTFS